MVTAPLILRELSTSARRRRVGRARFWISAGGLLALVILMILGESGLGAATSGKTLFESLSRIIFWYCLYAGVVATADTVSAEKRDGTLGLLFLTDLRGHDVVGGKLVAASLAVAYGILGLVPMLAVLLLMGGVTLSSLGWTAMVWLTALVLSAAAGMMTSSLSRQERSSLFAGWVVAFSVTVLLHELAGTLQTNVRSAVSEDASSPLWIMFRDWVVAADSVSLPMCLDRLGTSMGPMQWAGFYSGIVLHWILAGVMLAGASRWAARESRDLPHPAWQLAIRRWIHAWAYGSGHRRDRRRARLLDRSPVLWLCARHQRKRGYAWLFVISMAGVVGSMSLALRGFAWPGLFVFLLQAVFHGVFKFWMASDVCHRLIDDRRSQALELVLTTPVDMLEIARGHFRAVWHQLGPPMLVLVAGEFLWVRLMALEMPEWREAGLLWSILAVTVIRFLADAWALPWLSLWNSMGSATATKAVMRSLAAVWGVPGAWMITVFLMGFGGVIAFGVNSNAYLARMLWWWMALSVVNSIALGAYARTRFLRTGRRIASEGDPRDRLHHGQDPKPAAVTPVGRGLLQGSLLRGIPGRWRWAAALAVPVLVALTVVVLQRARRLATFQGRVAAVESRGDPLPPALPPNAAASIPDTDNAVVQLKGLFMRMPGRPRGLGRGSIVSTPELGRLLRNLGNEPLNERQVPLLEDWLVSNRAALDAFRTAIARPRVGYLFEASPWSDHGLPDLGHCNEFATLLQAELLIAVFRGSPDGAERAIRDLLRLCQILGDHPGREGQNVRFSMLRKALDWLEFSLASLTLLPDQKERLARGLSEAVDERHVRQVLQWHQARIVTLVRNPETYRSVMGSFIAGSPTWMRVAYTALMHVRQWNGSIHEQAARSLDQVMRMLEIHRLPLEARPSALDEAVRNASERRRAPRTFWNTHGFGFADPGILQEDIAAVARVRCALAALAMDQAQIRSGSLPRDGIPVSDLLSGVSAPDSQDPFSGKPLLFRRAESAFWVEGSGRYRSFRSERPPKAIYGEPNRIRFVVDRSVTALHESPPAGPPPAGPPGQPSIRRYPGFPGRNRNP